MAGKNVETCDLVNVKGLATQQYPRIYVEHDSSIICLVFEMKDDKKRLKTSGVITLPGYGDKNDSGDGEWG